MESPVLFLQTFRCFVEVIFEISCPWKFCLHRVQNACILEFSSGCYVRARELKFITIKFTFEHWILCSSVGVWVYVTIKFTFGIEFCVRALCHEFTSQSSSHSGIEFCVRALVFEFTSQSSSFMYWILCSERETRETRKKNRHHVPDRRLLPSRMSFACQSGRQSSSSTVIVYKCLLFFGGRFILRYNVFVRRLSRPPILRLMCKILSMNMCFLRYVQSSKIAFSLFMMALRRASVVWHVFLYVSEGECFFQWILNIWNLKKNGRFILSAHC